MRKGRVLTPRSRMRYRFLRVRKGRVVGGDLDELSIGVYAVRLVTIPLLVLWDWVTWPVVRRIAGRGPWYVVEVRFHGEDAEFVRIAEAPDQATAQQLRREFARGAS